MGDQQRIALLIELERPAHALEAEAGQRVADRGAILLARLFDRQQSERDRIVRFRRVGIGHAAERFLIFVHEGSGGGDIRAGGHAEMRGEIHAVHGGAAELDVFGRGDAVRTEADKIEAGLHELLGDERPFGIARPLDHGLGRAGLDAAELRREVDVAAGVAFVGNDLEAVLLARGLEGLEAAAAEIVVDVEEGELLQLGKFLVDEARKVGDQLGVGDGRAEHPLVALGGDALRGAGDHDLRRLRLAADLRGREARRAADASDGDQNLVTGDQPFGDVHGLFRLAGVVAVDGLNLLAADAAGVVLLLDRELDRLLLARSHGGGVAGQRAEHADLDGLGGRGLRAGRGEQCGYA